MRIDTAALVKSYFKFFTTVGDLDVFFNNIFGISSKGSILIKKTTLVLLIVTFVISIHDFCFVIINIT